MISTPKIKRAKPFQIHPEGVFVGKIVGFAHPRLSKRRPEIVLVRPEIETEHGSVFDTWACYYPAYRAILAMHSHYVGMSVRVKVRHRSFEYRDLTFAEPQILWPGSEAERNAEELG